MPIFRILRILGGHGRSVADVGGRHPDDIGSGWLGMPAYRCRPDALFVYMMAIGSSGNPLLRKRISIS
jgi:hypothetical protein